jgi:hypothetical protein
MSKDSKCPQCQRDNYNHTPTCPAIQKTPPGKDPITRSVRNPQRRR